MLKTKIPIELSNRSIFITGIIGFSGVNMITMTLSKKSIVCNRLREQR